MRVLYVTRKLRKSTFAWLKFIKEKLFYLPLKGQDGFFEGSMLTVFPDLELAPIEKVIEMKKVLEQKYEWVVVNEKCYGKNISLASQDLSWLKSLNRCRKALFIDQANANYLPEENILDMFDVVFKRELLKDLDRYKIRQSTMQKLHVTMLACPLIQARFSKTAKKIIINPINLKQQQNFEHDLTFVGANTSLIRRNTLMELSKSDVNFYGGLYDHITGRPLDWDGPGHPMETKISYMQRIARSRINLALDGKGAFTFRHLDIWYTGGFMLSTASILDLQLPGGIPEEGKHFASFKDYKGLLEKISYYLKNDSERLKIASAGHEFFRSIYDFKKHGRQISGILSSF